MALTDREIKIWKAISEWEEKLYEYQPTDIESYYDKWLEQAFSLLSPSIQEHFFLKLDNWLFHMNALIQSSQIQIDARERILTAARIFDSNISSLADLKGLSIDQLIYLADQQITRHRLYSLTQGGLSGTGETLLLVSDLPAIMIINLRVVQLIAMTYGYEVNTPLEIMISLKVFHAGTMPKRMQKQLWEEIIRDTEGNETFFYEGSEELTNVLWLEQPIRQILKAAAISLFRKKLIKGLPLVSMAIGAGANYQLTRNVTDFAHKFYQYRFLLEKKEKSDEYI